MSSFLAMVRPLWLSANCELLGHTQERYDILKNSEGLGQSSEMPT